MSKVPDQSAKDFDPEVLRLFDQYVHGAIDRRGFLIGAARFAVGATTAAGLLAALSPQFAAALEVAGDDKRLVTEYVEFPSPQGYGTARGYLVKPAKIRKPLPVVLVVHENRGLNPHIEDIARRLAPAGEAGVTLGELAAEGFAGSADRPEAAATGPAGTVYLCHPFLVLAAQPHRGTEPRFMAQPPLTPRAEFSLDGPSPMEQAIRRALSETP